MKTLEANFDGLVGPTHNYAGLALGNVASARNAAQPSNPREAVLQGLAKMKALHDLGLPQGILPPQERPHLPTLRALGFHGSDADVLRQAQRQAPGLLAAACSASSMWTANAATVSPSVDCADARVHFTPANLCTHLHRALETQQTTAALKRVFPDPRHFVHHAPLPATPALGDEGAANHTRLCADYGSPGVELFVYGRGNDDEPSPKAYPARQTRAACEALARLHRLDRQRTVLAQQNPQAIDLGVFHNDVIAVGNRNLLLCHHAAFGDRTGTLARLRQALTASELQLLELDDDEVTVAEAVESYLFNSQLVCPPALNGRMLLVAAGECRERPRVWNAIQRLLAADNPLAEVRVFDLRQSMRNGGGPACLRLRVVLTEPERRAVNPACWLDHARYLELVNWAQRHYRDRLLAQDLNDPQLLDDSRRALDRLTQILGLGNLYDFQHG
ncbi:MAG: N-succinylarginine dihydrolase [Gammaproteobacteria bacterium]|nr:N-succinylarginine dihydrolase [Gammaproteobacteria bacterium]